MKRLNVKYFLLLTPYLLLILIGAGFHMGGPGTYSGFYILFFIHPLVDILLGNRGAGLTDKIDKADQEMVFKAYIPAMLLFIGFTFYSYFQLETVFEKTGLALSSGLVLTGLGYTTAHELIHRANPFERFFGIVILCFGNYGHFRIEHVYGHHRNVGTEKDPAFAPKGSNIYPFLFRSFIGGLISAYKIENKKLRNKTILEKLYLNRNHHYYLISIISSIVFYLIDPGFLIFWWSMSFFAMLLLETINYVEHYGLERKKLADGTYEKVKPKHSWDSDFSLTNISLFNLGRHSHHHSQAGVPFYLLKNDETAKKHPIGYSGGILLAFFPPIWRMVIHPALK